MFSRFQREFFFFLRFWRENMVLVGKCVIRLLCVFADLVGKCIFTVLVGKIHFYGFDKKVFLRVWPKSAVLRVWLKNVFMENVFLRFCIFCSFGGNVRFLVITKKFICKKNQIFLFEKSILVLKGYFCHLLFWSERDASASRYNMEIHPHLGENLM